MDDSPPRRKIGHDSRDLRQAEGGRPQETAGKESRLRGRPAAQRTLIIAPQRECGATGPLQDRKLADWENQMREGSRFCVSEFSKEQTQQDTQRYRGEIYYRKGLVRLRWPRSPTICLRPAGGPAETVVSPGLSPKNQEPRRLRAGGAQAQSGLTLPLPFCSFQALSGRDDAPGRATESNAHLFQKPRGHSPGTMFYQLPGGP